MDSTANWSSGDRYIWYAFITGDREPGRWSPQQAAIQARDDLLVALADLQEAARRSVDLSTYVADHRQSRVLVCGNYGEGAASVERVSQILGSLDYDPFLLTDTPDIPAMSLPQKFSTFALSSRFVVVEDSFPGGQNVELQMAHAQGILTLVLRGRGKRGTWMTAGGALTSRVFREMEYEPDQLPQVVEEGVTWAEAEFERLDRGFGQLYPWVEPP